MAIEHFIDTGKFTSENFSIIFKALLFLDQPIWAQENIATVRKMLLLLCGSTKCLTEPQITLLQKTINHYLEPYSLLTELEADTGQTLANYKIGDFYPNESYIVAVTSGKHYRGMLVAREVVNKAVSMQSLIEVFPFISTIDMETCNKYWMTLLKFLQSPTKEYSDSYLFIASSRYLIFSSNMSWYRNIAFEKQLIHLLTEKLVEGVAGHIPSQFACIVSFLLAYDQPKAPSMPKYVVSRLLEYMNQLSVNDCETISKGLKIAMNIRRRGNLTQEFLQQFVNLDAALNSRAMQFLNEEEKHSVHRLNKIMRGYILRKGTIDTELFHRIIRKYEVLEESDLSSRSIRDTTYNLVATNCLIPELIDKLVSYCINQKEHIIGDTVCKLIFSAYYLGYTPTQEKEFFDVVSRLIVRDKERLTGLGLLQACLALSYFIHLPPPLVQFVFSVDFLEQLDEEIKHCFAKATYPVRIRRCLMELNRTVCLDQPEASVPWFHTKYCEEQQALGLQEHSNNSSFHTDVYHTLALAVGSKDNVQTNVSSPYGYNIDLQVCFDQDHKPVDPRKAGACSLKKVAVLLQNYDCFTTNIHQLKGYYQMKQRHLEIMGYKVISINDALWNAMYMTEPKAKLHYINNQIWPQNS